MDLISLIQSVCCSVVIHLSLVSSSELSEHFFVPSAGAPDVSVSDVPGAKRQGGLRVPGHRLDPRPVLRVSAGQPPGGQHLPQHRRLRVHGGPQEEQRQPGGPEPVPPHLGPAGRWEALHLHLQGLPGRRLQGEQHGRPPPWGPLDPSVKRHRGAAWPRISLLLQGSSRSAPPSAWWPSQRRGWYRCWCHFLWPWVCSVRENAAQPLFTELSLKDWRWSLIWFSVGLFCRFRL